MNILHDIILVLFTQIYVKKYAFNNKIILCNFPKVTIFITHNFLFVIYKYIYIYIQGVPGGRDKTSGGCSLGQTIPI